MLKKLTLLIFTLSTLTLSANEPHERIKQATTEVVDQAEKTFKKYKKCCTKKKCKKSFKKLKKKFIAAKDEIIDHIADSELSDLQKAGLVEAIQNIEAAAEIETEIE